MSAFLNLGITAEAVEAVSIEFGEWLPDLAEHNNPGAVEALNVIPGEGGYVPFRDLSLISGLTLPAAANSGIQMLDRSGSPHLYAGTAEGIYQRVSSGFTQRYSASPALYEDLRWQFVQFGWNVVALHPLVAPLVADVGGSSSFSPLGGDPPIAQCGARVGDFLVLGNLDNEADTEPRQPSRIRWSGFNNIEAPWITDPATQADFNDMPSEGGPVTAITGREYGTVFQSHNISRMSYVGLPTVFDIETVEEGRGAIAGGSVVDMGAFVFFLAEDGFHIWNGTNSTPIADNKVNRYFFRTVNYGAIDQMIGAIDYVNKCVMWAFPTGSGTALTEILIYSYKENKWSHAVRTVECLLSGYTFDASLDDMLGNLDTGYPITFDDGSFRGGRVYLGGFDNTHSFGLFNGSNLAITIDTGEFSGPNGTRVFVNGARPMVNTTTAVTTLSTARRDQLLGGALTFDAAVAQEITGVCPILADARYMRFRASVPAGASWTQALGVEIWRKAAGLI